MGILNVTPDSFSDGGLFVDVAVAVGHGLAMLDEGATFVDVGGESTRPGAESVSAEQEINRVVPVIAGLKAVRPDARISIDTMKAEVARAALDAGASFVNDVSAGVDPRMFPLVAERGVDICLMHMLGEPRTMQDDPRYSDVVTEVLDKLLHRAQVAMDAGIARDRIVIDPGIGFGKTVTHNLQLLKGLEVFVDTGFPVLVGASRKSFIGLTLGLGVEERLEGSLAVAVWAASQGARILRVHDIKASVRAVRMARAILDV